jgi:RNA polymerase sigma factor (sigma-70 family)
MTTIPRHQEVFEEHLLMAGELIGRICSRHRLSHEEAEDFYSFALFKLIEDDYARLRSFQGRSRLKTFLTVVLHRLFLDYRIQKWGKWRPTAEVRELGKTAVELDRLLSRDGQTLENAVEILRSRSGGALTRQELVALASRLPQRQRIHQERLEDSDQIPTDGGVEECVQNRELARTSTRVEAALAKALRDVPEEDRLILKMRYEEGLKVREIASTLGLEERPLFTRFDRCHRRLRKALETFGITWSDVLSILGWTGADLRADFGGQRKRSRS